MPLAYAPARLCRITELTFKLSTFGLSISRIGSFPKLSLAPLLREVSPAQTRKPRTRFKKVV